MSEIPPDEAESHASEEDFVHESVELPGWVPAIFGLILVLIALAAIWTA